MAAKYSSNNNENDFSLKQNIRLCSRDQNNPGSCTSSNCSDFHLCREYLLKNKCTTFESTGQCSRYHSLFTNHNTKILKNKLQINANDDDAFDRIAKYVKRSEGMSNDDDDHHSSPSKSSSHLPPAPFLTNSSHLGKSSVVFRTSGSSMNPISSHHLSTSFANSGTHSMLTNSNASSSASLGFGSASTLTSSTRKSMSMIESSKNNDLHSTHSRASGSNFKLPEKVITIASTFVDPKSDTSRSNGLISSDNEWRYIFDSYYQADHLSCLFGPIRRELNKKQGWNISTSGYCRIVSPNLEHRIGQDLEQAMRSSFRTVDVQLPSEDIALVASTSAAAKIFEKEQKHFGIMSTSFSHTFQIEVIRESEATTSKYTISTRLPPKVDDPYMTLSMDKLTLHDTNSTIEVIQGDISRTTVDMVVCVTTSKTLLNIILDKAGSAIESEYRINRRLKSSFVLDGGNIPVKKILFSPWELEVDKADIHRAQQSLSGFVQECINTAYEHKMKSIAFPPIGTGEIGISPNKVSEAMINAAHSCLQKYTMNVRFVILPPRKPDGRSELFDTFCNYLGELSRKSSGLASGHASMTSKVGGVAKSRRNGRCKHISLISDQLDTKSYQTKLINSLENLIEERTLDLRLIQKPLLSQVDRLIELCLGYHILPRIDFTRGDLMLRGDHDSCSQCFANLQNERKVSRFFLYDNMKESFKDISLNTYVSLKIEEGIGNDDNNIEIEDNKETVYYIDIRNRIVKINQEPQIYTFVAEQLNTSSIPSLSSPLFKILTEQIENSSYSKLTFLREFERFMPTSQWNISEIHSIDNWPLYVHHTLLGKPHDLIYAYYSCPFSSVQSVIHYGLHSSNARPSETSLQIDRNPLKSHIYDGFRGTDGKYYMFVVQISSKLFSTDSVTLTNEHAHLALPKYLITYERK